MKCVVALLALIALASAQHHGGHTMQPGDNQLADLVRREVQNLLHQNHGSMSIADCTTQCDAMFTLAAGHDEEITDMLCHNTCQHEISSGHHGHFTRGPTSAPSQ